MERMLVYGTSDSGSTPDERAIRLWRSMLTADVKVGRWCNGSTPGRFAREVGFESSISRTCVRLLASFGDGVIGNTTGSDPVVGGSNPSLRAIHMAHQICADVWSMPVVVVEARVARGGRPPLSGGRAGSTPVRVPRS